MSEHTAIQDLVLAERARELAGAATPGPWSVRQLYDEYNRLISQWNVPEIDALGSFEQSDAAFIAAARVLVPDLAAAVEQLTQALDKARAELREAEARGKRFCREHDVARRMLHELHSREVRPSAWCPQCGACRICGGVARGGVGHAEWCPLLEEG